jgi:hypothetical protein
LGLSVRFVGLKSTVPESRGSCIKGNSQVGGCFLVNNLYEGVGKAQYSTGVHTLGVDPWVVTKSKVRSVDQCHGIEEKEFVSRLVLAHTISN